jgi:hypothetical protein
MAPAGMKTNEPGSGKYKLPVSVSSFPIMVEENYIYVDKTEYVYNLINKGRIYFLSRPRRFGKTLLVSILEEIFKGNKHLFKNYFIYERIQWKKYPVIHLDFLGIDYESLGIEEALIIRLDEIAAQYGLQLTGKSSKARFADLIKKLSAKKKERVVVLVDEYDKPIIDYVEKENLETAEKNREKLRIFFSVLKHQDRNLKFLFITGVSRFSRVSFFSDLNNLHDITIHRDFSRILGYTGEEIEEFFYYYIDRWSREAGKSKQELMDLLKIQYNGYSWDGKHFVYSPESIHKALDESCFGNYWFSTGTPAFLVKKLMEQGIDIANFENMTVKRQFFDGFDISNLKVNLLLFQTGYLTIKELAGEEYRLYYPNKEVQSAFLHLLLEIYSFQDHDRIEAITPTIHRALEGKNIGSFVETARILFTGIPYNIFLSYYEAYYHSIIFTSLKLANVDATAEIETNKGRLDMLVKTQRYIYIIEFKMDGAMNALKQILEKKYYEPFLAQEKEIILVGIGFSREIKNISQVKYACFHPKEKMSLPLSMENINIDTLDYPAEAVEFAQ